MATDSLFCFYMPLSLTSPVSSVHTAGRQLGRQLQHLGITTVGDLLWYAPFRYDDFSHVVPIVEVTPGSIVTIRGTIATIKTMRSWKRHLLITDAIIDDGTGQLHAQWFGQFYVGKTLAAGDLVSLAGKADERRGISLINPAYEKITATKASRGTTHTGRLVPVYKVTRGLTPKQLRFLIERTLSLLPAVAETLPAEIISAEKLPNLREALTDIHFPKNQQRLEAAQARFRFEELLLIQLQNRLVREKLAASTSPAIPFQAKIIKKSVNMLPFKLTTAQRRSIWEIIRDLERGHPMNRLLEGDVGSGKTLVAALVALNVAAAGAQTVLMAPTDILAQQHYATFKRLLSSHGVKVGLLTRTSRLNNAGETLKRSQFLAALKAGEIEVLVGTHAIIQPSVKWHRLALAIVDEQHRFGVSQRSALQQVNDGRMLPHFLSMTATPIPRSLALTLYGDLDVSLLDEMPPGRTPVATSVVPPAEQDTTYQFVAQQITAGRQAFVICLLIDPTDALATRSVTEMYQHLTTKVFPETAIGLIHGKLPTAQKEAVMTDFVAGKTKILVATSVIEVGVDIPNASVMIIEGAERFGLAQLHQFRGRVGRGQHQSYCFLFSDSANATALKRLQALVTTNDGFKLAEYDLHQRGPGELLGTTQSGLPDLKFATLFDVVAIKHSQQWAEQLLQRDITLRQWPGLRAQLAAVVRRVHLE